MAPVALVAMSVSDVVRMVDVIKPRNVDVRPSIVIARLIFAACSMRMGHHHQLAGEAG